MEQNEVTIKQIAEECGVSKSTAVRKFKELNLPTVTRGGKGTVFLGPEAASMLAHALGKSRTPTTQTRTIPSTESMAKPVESLQNLDAILPRIDQPTAVPDQTVTQYDIIGGMYREQIKSLNQTNELLRNQIEQLNTVIEMMKSQHDSTIAVFSDQINHLNAQLEETRKEKERLREELAMSRALEGFHFPWQRDRIVSRYLLPQNISAEGIPSQAVTPQGSNEQSDEPTYEA